MTFARAASRLTALLIVAVSCSQPASLTAPEPLAAPPSDEPIVQPLRPDHEAEGFVGVIAPIRSTAVTAPVSAEVAAVRVHMGERVDEGQTLLLLGGAVMDREIAAASAAVDAARAAHAQASLGSSQLSHKLKVERALYREGIASRNSVRDAKLGSRRSRAAAAEAAARSREAKTRLRLLEDSKTIVAPRAGVVSLDSATSGRTVRPGDLLLRIFDPDDLVIRFAVPSSRAAALGLGTPLTMRLNDAGTEISGIVRTIAPESEPSLEMTIVEAKILGRPTTNIRAGAMGRVILPSEQDAPPSQ